MSTAPNRRQFIARSAGVAAGASVLPAAVLARADAPLAPGEGAASSVYAAFPIADPEVARQVVGFSHANLDGLKPLIEKQPELAKASIDWGSATGKPRSERRRTWAGTTSPSY